MDRDQFTSMLAFLASVPDPRQARGKRYPWELLLAIVCAALLSRHFNASAMAEWAAEHRQEISAWLGVTLRRTPSHSTLRRALRYLDIEALERQVAAFIQTLEQEESSETVVGADGQPLRGLAIDGKDVRGAGAHGEKVHLLSVVQHGSGDTLAQQQVGEKTNEIPAVLELLAGRDLRGTVITVDALNTQRATAELIIGQGGDYLMVVKKNQPTLYEDIETLFQSNLPPEASDRDRCSRPGKGHGRLERRTLACSSELGGYLDWPGATQVARRRCWRKETKSGEVSDEVSYAVTSLRRERAGARQLEALWRAHWTIENRDHYVRDETLQEDRCQMHKGNAPQALAALRNGLLAALRHHGWDNIAAATRHYGAFATRALAFINGNRPWIDRARAGRRRSAMASSLSVP
jgi:predicted transposase YbfD/YdcC